MTTENRIRTLNQDDFVVLNGIKYQFDYRDSKGERKQNYVRVHQTLELGSMLKEKFQLIFSVGKNKICHFNFNQMTIKYKYINNKVFDFDDLELVKKLILNYSNYIDSYIDPRLFISLSILNDIFYEKNEQELIQISPISIDIFCHHVAKVGFLLQNRNIAYNSIFFLPLYNYCKSLKPQIFNQIEEET